MGVIDAVIGGVGTGVQPKDSVAPSGPQMTGPERALDNSIPGPIPIPPGAPSPQMMGSLGQSNVFAAGTAPEQAPSPMPNNSAPEPTEDPEVSALFEELKGKQPKQAKEQDSELGKLFDDYKGTSSDELPADSTAIEAKLANEPFWNGYLRNQKENAKVLITKVRAQLENSEEDKSGIFSAMYGADNVRKKDDGTFQFRPDGSRKWRNISAAQSDAFTDFFTTNVLRALPLAANVLTQAVTAPEQAATGLPGMMLGGAVGGAVEGTVQEAEKSAMDTVLGINPNRKPAIDAVLWNAGINAATPPLLSGAQKVAGGIGKAAVWAANKTGVSQAATHVIEQMVDTELASQSVQKLANIRAGLSTIAERYFPSSANKTYQEVGEETLGAITAERARLGKAVGAVDDEALRITEEQGLKSQGENVQRKIGEELKQNHGFVKDPETGHLKRGPQRKTVHSTKEVPSFSGQADENGYRFPTGDTEVKEVATYSDPVTKSAVPGFDSSLDTLASYHNRLVDNNVSDGGTDLSEIFNDMENLLKPASKFGKDVPNETAKLYQSVYGAAASDRDALMTTAFEGADSESAKSFKRSYSAFRENVDSLAAMEAHASTPEGRDMLVNSFTKASTEDRVAFVGNLEKVFGKDSGVYQKFRGGVFNDLLNKNVAIDGTVNAERMFKWFNEPVASKLYSKNELASFRRMMVEAKKLGAEQKTDIKSVASFAGAFGKVAAMIGDPGEIVGALFKSVGASKAAIDYMNDVGFLNLIKEAKGTQMYNNFLKAQQISEELVSKMKILDVGTKGRSNLQRYIPYAGPALAKAITESPAGQVGQNLTSGIASAARGLVGLSPAENPAAPGL